MSSQRLDKCPRIHGIKRVLSRDLDKNDHRPCYASAAAEMTDIQFMDRRRLPHEISSEEQRKMHPWTDMVKWYAVAWSREPQNDKFGYWCNERNDTVSDFGDTQSALTNNTMVVAELKKKRVFVFVDNELLLNTILQYLRKCADYN